MVMVLQPYILNILSSIELYKLGGRVNSMVCESQSKKHKTTTTQKPTTNKNLVCTPPPYTSLNVCRTVKLLIFSNPNGNSSWITGEWLRRSNTNNYGLFIQIQIQAMEQINYGSQHNYLQYNKLWRIYGMIALCERLWY